MFVRTLRMVPKSAFVDALMMYLKAIILQVFREKSWFGLATKENELGRPFFPIYGPKFSKFFFVTKHCGISAST